MSFSLKDLEKDIRNAFAGNTVMRPVVPAKTYAPTLKQRFFAGRGGNALVGFQNSIPGKVSVGLKETFVDKPMELGKTIGNFAVREARTNPFSKQYLRGAGDIAKKAVPVGLSLGGATKAGLRTLGAYSALNAGVEGALNKVPGETRAVTGIKRTAEALPRIIPKAGLYSVTNPATDKLLSAAKITKFIPKNIGVGLSNIGEDVITSKLGLDPDLTPGQAVASFLTPGVLDAASAPLRKVASSLTAEQAQKLFRDKRTGKFTTSPGTSENRVIKITNQGVREPDLKFKDYVPNESAFGLAAGVEPEYDENGKITGFKYNPAKAAVGVGLAAGLTKVGGSKELIDSIAKEGAGLRGAGQSPKKLPGVGPEGAPRLSKVGSVPAQAIDSIRQPLQKSVPQTSTGNNLPDQYGRNTEKITELGYRGSQESLPASNGLPETAPQPANKLPVLPTQNQAEPRATGPLNSGRDIYQNPTTAQEAPTTVARMGQQTQGETKSQNPLYTPTYKEEEKLYKEKLGSYESSDKIIASLGFDDPKEGRDAIEFVSKQLKPGQKVNLLDYFRTPERVLNKIGLGSEAKLLRRKHEDYLAELPKQIDKVTAWFKKVGRSEESSRKIFRVLDGTDNESTLNTTENEVKNEIKDYLADWADRLGLPNDKRIASYITHIFEDDFIQKEFDQDLAKLIVDRVPGSVYDPFLQQRLGARGYVEDVFRALDAYTKRAVRKYHMDQALGPLKEASEKLDLESWSYVKRLADRVNLRPTETDNLLDNLIKSTLGYRFTARPTATLTRKLRNMVYRGTLGLNLGSAIKNLTQGVNTYAELGEKWTGVGYFKAMQDLTNGSKELQDVGVLSDQFIEDRTISATKELAKKIDESLWVFFDLAEKVNRGASYFGAKSKALAEGKSLEEAIEYGKEITRKTQFSFGSIDTPVNLQGDLVKLITQFQSYNFKQAEYLIEMLKNKEFIKVFRWAAGNALVAMTLGSVINYEFSDAVPFYNKGQGTRFGQTPALKLAADLAKYSLGAKDKYGNPIKFSTISNDIVPLIPGGVQAKKTIGGLAAFDRGYSQTPSGKVRYPIPATLGNLFKTGLFGEYSTPEARQYFDGGKKPVGKLRKINSNTNSNGGLRKL